MSREARQEGEVLKREQPGRKEQVDIGRVAASESVDPEIALLIEDIGSTDFARHSNARGALRKIGSPATDALISALTDSNNLRRGHAMELLGEIGDERAIGPLERASVISLEDYKRLGGVPLDEVIDYWECDKKTAAKFLARIRERHSSPDDRSGSVATEESTESLIAQLGRRQLGPDPCPAMAQLRERGKSIVPQLLDVLDGSDIPAAADAIQLLGEIGAIEVIPRLQALSNSQWAEINQPAQTALAILTRKEGGGLRLDRARPFGQVGELWTAIIQSRQKLCPPEELNAFCLEATAAMPELAFASKDDEGRTWGMLGSLLYKSVYPDWHGDWYQELRPCREAKRCFEEAFRADGDFQWKDRADRIPDLAPQA